MRYCPLLCLLALLACDPIGIDPPNPNVYDPAVFETAFREIELRPGVRAVSLNNGFTATDFMLHVPTDTSTLRPLVFALHWWGDDDAYRDYFDCLVVPGLDTLDAFIIAPRDDEDNWQTTLNLFNVSELRSLALQHWPVHPDRIVVTGYNHGGIGSFNYATNYGELFDAAIPVAGRYAPTTRINLPVLLLHGENDNRFPVAGTRQELANAQSYGTDIELRVVPDLGHGDGCAYAPALHEAALWLLEEVW